MKRLQTYYRLFLLLGWAFAFLLVFDYLLGDEGFLPPGAGFLALSFLIAALTLDVVRSALQEHLRNEHKK